MLPGADAEEAVLPVLFVDAIGHNHNDDNNNFSPPPGVRNFGFTICALCLLRDVEKETHKHKVLWEKRPLRENAHTAKIFLTIFNDFNNSKGF